MTREQRQILAMVENSPLAWEVRGLVKERAHRVSSFGIRHVTRHGLDGRITRWREIECWCSGAAWLLNKLNIRAAPANKNSGEWPKTPQQLGVILNKLTPGLQMKNVHVTYSRHGLYGRLWTLWAIDKVETVDTLVSEMMRQPLPYPR